MLKGSAKAANNRLKALCHLKALGVIEEHQTEAEIYRQAIVDFLVDRDESVLIDALGKKRFKRNQIIT